MNTQGLALMILAFKLKKKIRTTSSVPQNIKPLPVREPKRNFSVTFQISYSEIFGPYLPNMLKKYLRSQWEYNADRGDAFLNKMHGGQNFSDNTRRLTAKSLSF